MSAFRRLSLVRLQRSEREGYMNAAEDQHAVLHLDFPLGQGAEGALAGLDPARLQRAPKGAEESPPAAATM